MDGGGGLGVEYGTAAFDAEASVAAYATGLRGVMEGLGAHLLLEPGRFVVAQAGVLLTRVLYTKGNGSKHFVITYGAHHEILPVVRSDRPERVADVVGPVCESSDFFARGRPLPEMHAGELLALLDAGAYGMSLSSHYNTRVRPAEVLAEGGQGRLIRRRETLEDLLAPEVV